MDISATAAEWTVIAMWKYPLPHAAWARPHHECPIAEKRLMTDRARMTGSHGDMIASQHLDDSGHMTVCGPIFATRVVHLPSVAA
jgi:hypothetical protein